MSGRHPSDDEHLGRLFVTRDCGEFATVTFGPCGPLRVTDLDELERLWDFLAERGRGFGKKVLLILAPPDSCSPRNVDTFWDSIRSHLAETKPVPGVFRAELEVARAENAHRHFVEVVRSINSFVIAALAGECDFSFFGQALACDYRIATEDTVFVNRLFKSRTMPGVLPWFLARFLGHAHAADILLEGRSLTAHEAYELGLINKIVPADEFDRLSADTARRFASIPGPTIRAIKRTLVDADMDLNTYFDHCGTGFRLYARSITATETGPSSDCDPPPLG